MTMIGNTGLATTIECKRQTQAECEQGRNRVGSARIRAPIVRFCGCKVAWMNCPHRGIMRVIEDHLRPSGHIMTCSARLVGQPQRVAWVAPIGRSALVLPDTPCHPGSR